MNFTFAYDNHVMGAGYGSIEERRRAYADITPAQIRAAAGELFRRSNLTVSIKGKKKKINVDRLNEIIKGIG